MDKLTIKTNNIALKFNTGSIVMTGGNVESVNGKTGPSIILDATDVGAEPAGALQQAKDEIQPQINELNNEVDLIQPQLVNLSENKLDKVDYVQHFLGVFPSKAALDAAHPTARPGDSADIDSGSGFDVMRAIWDDSDHKWVVREVNNAQNTDQVPEGNTNLYFKSERVLATLLSVFNPVNAALTASDTIIQGLSKAQGQISNIISTFAANVRSTTLTGLNTATGGAITAADTHLSAFGKIQNFMSNQSAMVWVNANTLAGWYLHSAISSAAADTKIEVCKYQGMIWVRGYFKQNTQIGSNIKIMSWTDVRYMTDVSFTKSGITGSPLARVFVGSPNYGNNSTLLFSHGVILGDEINVINDIVLNAAYFYIPPVCLGAAKT